MKPLTVAVNRFYIHLVSSVGKILISPASRLHVLEVHNSFESIRNAETFAKINW